MAAAPPPPPPGRDCFPPADADLLGLGVRLGAYLQSASAILNLLLNADEAPGDAWMQLFTGLPITAIALKYILAQTISNGAFLATAYIGWAQMITLPATLLLPSVLEHSLLWAMAFAATMWTSGLYLWYFSVGFDAINWRVCPTTYAFFFGKVEAFSTWYRALSLVFLSLNAILNLAFLAPVVGAVRAAQVALAPQSSVSGQGGGGSRRRLVHLYIVFTAAFLTFLVVATELTLRWNDVEGVYSLDTTGQLIPLMVGIGTVLRVAYFTLHRATPWLHTNVASIFPSFSRGRSAVRGSSARGAGAAGASANKASSTGV